MTSENTPRADAERLCNELKELINDADEYGKRDPTVIPAETAERIVAALRATNGVKS